MTFMLSAFVKPQKIVGIIVPLRSLQKDLARRCTEAGIQSAMWGDRKVHGSRIIIASVEHVGLEDYQTFVRNAFLSDRLHAIFIDEGHLVLLWGDFCHAMRTLNTYVRPPNVNVPIITLTATSPPSITDQIAAVCGMSDYKTIRQKTCRPNIRYVVRDVSPEDLYRRIDDALCSQYKLYDTSTCRAIVYVSTRAACNTLSATLSGLSPLIPCFM